MTDTNAPIATIKQVNVVCASAETPQQKQGVTFSGRIVGVSQIFQLERDSMSREVTPNPVQLDSH